MTGTISPSIPQVNSPDSTEEPKIPSALITLRDALNAVLTSANGLDGGQLGTGTVGTAALAAKLITTGKIADKAVGTGQIADEAVDTGQLNDLAVGTAKLANNSVTSAKAFLATVSADGGGGSLTTSYANLAAPSTPAAGTYFVIGVVSVAAIGGTTTAYARISGDTSSESKGRCDANSESITVAAVRTLDGSTALAVQGKADAVGGVASVWNSARVIGVRIA